jgi:glutaminyl-peptide cyclotransferase
MYQPNRPTLTVSLVLPLLLVLSTRSAPANPLFRGSVALADTRRAVNFGQRPSGSPSIQRLRDWIVTELKPTGAQVSLDSFSGRAPGGAIPMANVIAKFPGSSGKAIAVTGHFDTKNIPGVHFVGANDGGSSTGFLVEFARSMAKIKHRDDIFLVFFDGEEAVGEWTDTNSRYGSRHLAAKWLADGTLARLKALINVDMIGDKDLALLEDGNSSPALRELARKCAVKLGYQKHFPQDLNAIDDDHRPFAEIGVNVIDLIDFHYGPENAYWHTASDTIDKLSGQSLQVVGDVVLEMLKELESRN